MGKPMTSRVVWMLRKIANDIERGTIAFDLSRALTLICERKGKEVLHVSIASWNPTRAKKSKKKERAHANSIADPNPARRL